MGELSEDSLLDYLRAAGGRVKNSDLLKAYKEYIGHSDQRLRATYREQFKAIVDKIAVVKTAENGEKQLVLRKKFAPQGPRPAARVQWDGGEAAAGSSPQAQAGTRGAAAGSPKEQKKAVLVPWEMAPAITVAETPEPSRPEERPAPPLALEPDEPPEAAPLRRIPEDGRAEEPGEESPTPSLQEEEPEPDAVSKSESERDDDGSGSVGSHGVALDPLEKEWMRSAACGQLAHLAQLLKQEPSLACKKDFTSVSMSVFLSFPLRLSVRLAGSSGPPGAPLWRGSGGPGSPGACRCPEWPSPSGPWRSPAVSNYALCFLSGVSSAVPGCTVGFSPRGLRPCTGLPSTAGRTWPPRWPEPGRTSTAERMEDTLRFILQPCMDTGTS
nr:PREDICTED: ankyrin repeat domain-containing protein SOWAHC-like isoform X2 [Lepisosteus oculatus]